MDVDVDVDRRDVKSGRRVFAVSALWFCSVLFWWNQGWAYGVRWTVDGGSMGAVFVRGGRQAWIGTLGLALRLSRVGRSVGRSRVDWTLDHTSLLKAVHACAARDTSARLVIGNWRLTIGGWRLGAASPLAAYMERGTW
jgi:hypothetical protein